MGLMVTVDFTVLTRMLADRPKEFIMISNDSHPLAGSMARHVLNDLPPPGDFSAHGIYSSPPREINCASLEADANPWIVTKSTLKQRENEHPAGDVRIRNRFQIFCEGDEDGLHGLADATWGEKYDAMTEIATELGKFRALRETRIKVSKRQCKKTHELSGLDAIFEHESQIGEAESIALCNEIDRNLPTEAFESLGVDVDGGEGDFIDCCNEIDRELPSEAFDYLDDSIEDDLIDCCNEIDQELPSEAFDYSDGSTEEARNDICAESDRVFEEEASFPAVGLDVGSIRTPCTPRALSTQSKMNRHGGKKTHRSSKTHKRTTAGLSRNSSGKYVTT